MKLLDRAADALFTKDGAGRTVFLPGDGILLDDDETEKKLRRYYKVLIVACFVTAATPFIFFQSWWGAAVVPLLFIVWIAAVRSLTKGKPKNRRKTVISARGIMNSKSSIWFKLGCLMLAAASALASGIWSLLFELTPALVSFTFVLSFGLIIPCFRLALANPDSYRESQKSVPIYTGGWVNIKNKRIGANIAFLFSWIAALMLGELIFLSIGNLMTESHSATNDLGTLFSFFTEYSFPVSAPGILVVLIFYNIVFDAVNRRLAFWLVLMPFAFSAIYALYGFLIHPKFAGFGFLFVLFFTLCISGMFCFLKPKQLW